MIRGGFWKSFKAKSLVIIFALCFAIYANTLFSGFVTDDFPNIVNNQRVKDFDVAYMFSTPFWTFHGGTDQAVSAYYTPLTSLSLALDYRIWGDNPAGYHLTLIIIHALASCLVFLLVYEISRKKWLSLASGLLFASFPVHAESVSWISGRTHIFALMLSVASLYFYVRFRESKQPRLYLASLALLGMGLLFKEVAIITTLLIVLYDYVFREKSLKGVLAGFVKKPWIYGGFAAVGSAYIIAVFLVTGSLVPQLPFEEFQTNPLFGRGLGLSLINAPLVILYYSLLMVFNVGYDIPPLFVTTLLDPVFMLSLLAAVVPLFLVFRYSDNNWLRFFVLWLYAGLIPAVLNLNSSTTFIVDRLSYFASPGMAVVIAFLAHSVASRLKGRADVAFIMLILVLVSVYSSAAYLRTYDWRDEVTLFSSIARRSPDNPYAHYEVGLIYAEAGRLQDAASEIERAIELRPDWFEARLILGSLYYAIGRYSDSSDEFEYAISIRPESAEAHKNLAFSYLGLGLNEKAIEEFEEAVRIVPGFADGYYNIGAVYLNEYGDLDQARFYFSKAVEIDPSNQDYLAALDAVSQSMA